MKTKTEKCPLLPLPPLRGADQTTLVISIISAAHISPSICWSVVRAPGPRTQKSSFHKLQIHSVTKFSITEWPAVEFLAFVLRKCPSKRHVCDGTIFVSWVEFPKVGGRVLFPIQNSPSWFCEPLEYILEHPYFEARTFHCCCCSC